MMNHRSVPFRERFHVQLDSGSDGETIDAVDEHSPDPISILTEDEPDWDLIDGQTVRELMSAYLPGNLSDLAKFLFDNSPFNDGNHY